MENGDINYRLAALEKLIYADGRAGLEERMLNAIAQESARMTVYVDKRDEHTKGNLMQAILNASEVTKLQIEAVMVSAQANGNQLKDLQTETKELRLESNERHEQNGSRFGKLETRIAWASGAAAVIIALVQHFWK